ncbi:MAG: hypothetical protein IPP46_03515 [Bacteroidetes bacterium]|nr:hypothetical protein [Bacteroidota bacterium]
MPQIDLEIIQYSVLGVLCLATGIQLYYLLFEMAVPGFRKTSLSGTTAPVKPVSVIICARNELKNLP